MQILEQTGFGVRSAMVTMTAHGSAVTFVVVPMVHVGKPTFYSRVRAVVSECDAVVVEGVGGARTQLLTLSYRIAGRLRRGGLVLQGDGFRVRDLDVAVVHPDVTGAEFSHGLRAVSKLLRWGLLLAAPVFGLWVAAVGPERAFAKSMSLDDLPSREEEELAHEQLDEVLIHSRDRKLLAALVGIHEEHACDSEPWEVAICWGAEHVRSIVPGLGKLGYRVKNAEWLTVM